jgi:L-aspartate oxidase
MFATPVRLSTNQGSHNSAMPPRAESSLRAMMSSHVGVVRNGNQLMDAVQAFAAIERNSNNIALRNMATTALIVAASAWSRRESRGAHFRSDYPAEDLAQRNRTMTTLNEARGIAASVTDTPPLKRTSAGA